MHILSDEPRALDLGPAPEPKRYESRREARRAMMAGELDLARYLEVVDGLKWQEGQLVPACGGAETPFLFEGRRYLYCWHTVCGSHHYLDLESDMVMPDDWHPSRH